MQQTYMHSLLWQVQHTSKGRRASACSATTICRAYAEWKPAHDNRVSCKNNYLQLKRRSLAASSCTRCHKPETALPRLIPHLISPRREELEGEELAALLAERVHLVHDLHGCQARCRHRQSSWPASSGHLVTRSMGSPVIRNGLSRATYTAFCALSKALRFPTGPLASTQTSSRSARFDHALM